MDIYYEAEAILKATCFDELADALLGVELPNLSNTFDPELDFGHDLVDQFFTTPSYNSASSDNNNDESVKSLLGSDVVQEQPRRSKKRKKEETEKKKLVVNGGKARRKRDPNQVQDHIIAERKRREVLSHMFISLSAMIPGLKKMDKTTILGDAIKHMKHLQEKVKELELAVSQRRNTKSVVVVKKYQLPMTNDNDDDSNGSSSDIVDDISGSNNNDSDSYATKNYYSSTLPEIEVRRSDNTILLKICCEKQKSVVSELIATVERHDLSITSSVVIPFDNLTLDINIVAKVEEGFNYNVKGLVRTLCSTLRSISP